MPAKRQPIEQLGDDVWDAVVLADVVDGENVGMVERRSRASLLFEATQAIGIGREGGREDFDGYVTTEARIAGTVDFPHSAGVERREDLVRTKTTAAR